MEDFSFPRLYAPWLKELAGDRIPSEKRSTCADCAMCAPLQPVSHEDYYFVRGVQCCSYMPSLPNFLVGAVLSDDTPAFAASREQFEREAVKAAVLPRGVIPPDYWLFMLKFKPFGKSELFLCPYADRNSDVLRCTIWPYRNAVCTTWFCKYDRRSFGWAFWNHLKELLISIERAVSDWCISQLDLRKPETAESAHQIIWGNWAGREREFYRECWKLVGSMSLEDALSIAGPASSATRSKLVAATEALFETRLPDRLKPGEMKQQALGNGFVRIWAYSRLDPIDVPEEIVELLPFFENRPVEEAAACMLRDRGRGISGEWMRLLLDAGVLQPA